MKIKKIYLPVFLSLAIISAGCESHEHSEGEEHAGHEHGESEEKHNHGADDILFSPEQAKAAGVVVEKINPGQFTQIIKTSGRIVSAQGDERTIVATASGIVSFSGAALTDGVAVSAGQILFSISSKGIVDGDGYNPARIAYDAAKKEYDRASELVKDRIISQREFESIRANYEASQAALSTVGGKAASTGVGVSTPISGYIVSRLVKQGDYVSVGQPIATVSQNRRLQLRADVPDRYFGLLSSVESANFTLPYNNKCYNLTALNGRRISYGKGASDQESCYIPMIFEFDNKGDMHPGSFVDVYLKGTAREGVITIPKSALTEEQGLFYVYIRESDHAYKKREVILGADDGLRIEVVRGLNGGEEVVVAGANHIKLAANTGKVPEGHSHNH